MSEAFWISLFNLIGILAVVYLNLRQNVKIQEIHDATNGMKKELVDEVRAASFARGEKAERDKGNNP